MADGEYRLLGIEKRLGERDHLGVGPQVVRRVAAWDEERVELIGSDLVDAGLRLRCDRTLLPFQLLAGFQADDRDLVPRLLERVVGLLELRVFVIDVQHAGNSHADTSLSIFSDIGTSD